MKNKIVFIIFIVLNISFQLHAQEICDNGIDDDNDGLIDLNDDDCKCSTFIPSSLIPNPSFEDKTCCPQQNARLDCAVGWIQASKPTTDYVHTCGGYLGNTSIPAYAPLPFPDGEGGVGFRDGQKDVGSQYKEYVGACLIEPLKAGTSYKLDFFVGFQDNKFGSKNFNIAVFASTNCDDLPFGNNSNYIGCPANTGKFVQVGEQSVSGSNEWINVVFKFEADQNYQTIILGPSCAANPNYIYDPYFYLDRLVLAESSEFGLPFDRIEGKICEDGITLSIEYNSANTYQWYKDGIAIIGENNYFLKINSSADAEGKYAVAINTPDGCNISREYNVRIPPYYGSVFTSICEDEEYLFGNQVLTEPGTYERTINALDGCDSIIELSLEVRQNSYYEFKDSFCFGDEYSFLDINTEKPGNYKTFLTNSIGCDSIITVDLYQIKHDFGILLQDTFKVDLGDKINIQPEYDDSFIDFIWYDENENTISNEPYIYDFLPLNSMVLYFEAIDQYGCSEVSTTFIEVNKSNYELDIPNIFTPNGDGLNEYFVFNSSKSVKKIDSILIFDRWGNNVYSESNVNPYLFFGWDGRTKGIDAMVGVYTYVIKVLYLDNVEKVYAGDLTLLK